MSVTGHDIELANQVAIALGDKGFNDFTATNAGKAFGAVYEDCKREFLMAYPWHETKRRAQLSQSSTAPVNRWQYAYDMPGDQLGPPLHAYNSKQATRPFTRWEYLNKRIETDASFCYIVYQVDIGVETFPEYMRRAFKGWLGAELAEAITGMESRIQIWAQYKDAWGMAARTRDAQLHPSQTIPEFRLVTARFGGRNG